MTGLLEHALIRVYGSPVVSEREGLLQLSWGGRENMSPSVLYRAREDGPQQTHPALSEVYGDTLGGSLVGGRLKVALLVGSTFDLYSLADLQNQPEVQRAQSMDPGVRFFMDASNVWYYGAKSGRLHVYDSETDELDSLGGIAEELERLLNEWRGTNP